MQILRSVVAQCYRRGRSLGIANLAISLHQLVPMSGSEKVRKLETGYRVAFVFCCPANFCN
ncbi:hypothetical protein EUTSA_v10023796mg [Eutrema salsugineum]|uniref:Uncharacterized protein n=1 Tax=Eutrema salsugineum TaxID=72664 RepID=V4MCM1_EUTSA|nr:hypothetical protein EUTSA_v10023796mg [Eutrema salsugineum]